MCIHTRLNNGPSRIIPPPSEACVARRRPQRLAAGGHGLLGAGGLGYLGAKYCTPEITKVNLYWKMPLTISWKNILDLSASLVPEGWGTFGWHDLSNATDIITGLIVIIIISSNSSSIIISLIVLLVLLL